MSNLETAASIRIQRRIEWSDTDASGHWHNTAAFRMIEWITYDFWIDRDDKECVKAKVVTALRAPDGGRRTWSAEHRRLLATAGPQSPELLTVPQRTTDEETSRRIRT